MKQSARAAAEADPSKRGMITDMSRFWACLMLALMPVALGAQGDEVEPGIYRLEGISETLSHQDLEPLDGILGDARVVGLGEAVHTTRGFSRAKFRLFRYMVERLDFRVFGFESSWIDADRVAEYVRTCEGGPEEAITGLFGVWQNESVRDLVAWMCGYNRENPDDPLHFYGFDIQAQGSDEVALLRTLLDKIGVAASSKRYRLLGNCAGNSPAGPSSDSDHGKCRSALDSLRKYFNRKQKRILKQISAEELEWARLHVVSLRAWEDEIFYLESDFGESFAARDKGMAYVAEAIRRIRFPEAKTALWAHNGHIAKGDLSPGVPVMGVHLEDALGADYKTVGLIAYEGFVDWPGVGCGLNATAVEGSVEWLLRELGEPYLLVDLAFPGGDPPFLEPGRVYDLSWGGNFIPSEHFDGLLYMEEAEKMAPLGWPPC